MKPGRTLSEAASKRLLAHDGRPVPPESVVHDAATVVAASASVGSTMVEQPTGGTIAHTAERRPVRRRDPRGEGAVAAPGQFVRDAHHRARRSR